ncbi:MAG: hypothetical protein HZA35_00110 [Parcubacteria group bacterium]|nr:hypothetical protein [Parcubacteria group bacterium]
MQISKKSLHYRWMKWVYGWYSYNPVPNNLCSYFWRLFLSPILFLLTLVMYVLSLCISLVLALFWWIAGYRPDFDFLNLRDPCSYAPPINSFSCGDYKTGLYGKNKETPSPIAPWEVFLVLGGIILMTTSIKLSPIILGISICLWLLILVAMRGGKLVGPFFHSVKEKHCKKLDFVD